MEKCFHGQDSHSVWIVHAWGTNTYFLVAFTLPYWMAVHIYGIIIKSTQNSKLYWKQQRYPNRNDDVWRLRKKQTCQISEYWNPGCNCVVLKCCFSAQELKRRFRSHKKAFLQLQELPLRDIFQGCFWRRKGAYSTVGTCELAKCAGRGASLICYTWNTIFVKKKKNAVFIITINNRKSCILFFIYGCDKQCMSLLSRFQFHRCIVI